MKRATSREIFMASVVITDYSRAIYGENSLIDGGGGKRERGEQRVRGVARTWEEKKGQS